MNKAFLINKSILSKMKLFQTNLSSNLQWKQFSPQQPGIKLVFSLLLVPTQHLSGAIKFAVDGQITTSLPGAHRNYPTEML